MSDITLVVDDREFAAILCGLALMENAYKVGGLGFWTEEIATNAGEFEALTPEEIGDLTYRLNNG